MRTNLRRKALGVLLAAVACTAVSAAPASAHYTENIPSPTPGGVGETMTFTATVPSPVYDPDPTAAFGPRQCGLEYHEYEATPGCGGFYVKTTLHNVQAQPGFISNAVDETRFTAHADAERTFGCRTADGSFDWNSAIVIRTPNQELSPVYITVDAGYLVQSLHNGPSQDMGPEFYLNFPAVDFNCPASETKVQYGLKVSNLRIDIADSPVFGTRTWFHPGPYYG